MASRTRSIVLPSTGGTFKSTPLVSGTSVNQVKPWDTATRDSCVDDSGKKNQPFTVNHFYGVRSTITHTAIASGSLKELVNYIPTYFESYGGSVAHQTVPGVLPNSTLANMLVRAINPSNPVVDLPVFFAEFRDLPSLIRRSGNSLIKQLSGANLKVEFALKPLIGDLKKLYDFQDHFDKRMKVLYGLKSGPMLRKASLWNGSVRTAESSLYTTNSFPTQCNIQHQKVSTLTTRKDWGYGNVVPSVDYNRLLKSDADLRWATRRIVLGLTVDAATIWELTPWSWLIDWFSDVGTILQSQRSIVPCSYVDLRLCTTTRTEVQYKNTASNNIGLPEGVHQPLSVLVTKERRLAFPGILPSLNLPLLTGRQVGILSSLSVLRHR